LGRQIIGKKKKKPRKRGLSTREERLDSVEVVTLPATLRSGKVEGGSLEKEQIGVRQKKPIKNELAWREGSEKKEAYPSRGYSGKDPGEGKKGKGVSRGSAINDGECFLPQNRLGLGEAAKIAEKEKAHPNMDWGGRIPG